MAEQAEPARPARASNVLMIAVAALSLLLLLFLSVCSVAFLESMGPRELIQLVAGGDGNCPTPATCTVTIKCRDGAEISCTGDALCSYEKDTEEKQGSVSCSDVKGGSVTTECNKE